MGKFVKGDVVIIPFPFSDLTGNKKRSILSQAVFLLTVFFALIKYLPPIEILFFPLPEDFLKQKFVIL